MREHKQNVFDDFHAAAERLVADGWTTPDQLAISGGSNGGLLVGAALTQRPELYRGRRVLGAAARHGALRAVRAGRDLDRRVRHAPTTRRSSAGCWATRRTTTCARASTTRRCCSPSSTATRASTRCTPARCAPRCSTPPSGDRARSCSGASGRRSRRPRGLPAAIELSVDALAFVAAPHRPGAAGDYALCREPTPYAADPVTCAPPISGDRGDPRQHPARRAASRHSAADHPASSSARWSLRWLVHRAITRVVARGHHEQPAATGSPSGVDVGAAAAEPLPSAAGSAPRHRARCCAASRRSSSSALGVRHGARRARHPDRAADRQRRASSASRSASARRAWSRTSCPASS